MFQTMLSHAENWFKELGVSADHEYHKAVTQFLGWAQTEETRLAAAVTMLVAKGYTVTPPAALVPPPAA